MFQRFKDQLASDDDYNLMELPRHALHAIALKIPYKKEEKIFVTHIPQDLKEWILEKTSLKIEDLEKKIHETIFKYYSRQDD